MRLAAFILMASSILAIDAARAPAARRSPEPQSSAARPPAAPQNYAFPSGAGMLFFYVKPEKVADFETVTARLAEALDRADDPIRKQQAAGWRILKSVETAKDAAIYVFVFDPAVADADYDPVKVLGEKQPADILQLYEKLRDSTIRVERMGMTKLR